jgi:hypothetical protein
MSYLTLLGIRRSRTVVMSAISEFMIAWKLLKKIVRSLTIFCFDRNGVYIFAKIVWVYKGKLFEVVLVVFDDR